jgi:hypothetical protein
VSGRRAWAAALGVGGVALAGYAVTLAPTVTSEDAGELITAADRLGVPHPPGFPLWVLLTHVLIRVSPGPAAYDANLASALFGAVAVAATVGLALRLGASVWAAGAAGLLLAFGRTFWSQAVIAEVYTLHAALLALALFAVVSWGQGRSDRWLFGRRPSRAWGSPTTTP